MPFDTAPQGGSTVSYQGAGRTFNTFHLLAFPSVVREVHPTDRRTGDLPLAEMTHRGIGLVPDPFWDHTLSILNLACGIKRHRGMLLKMKVGTWEDGRFFCCRSPIHKLNERCALLVAARVPGTQTPSHGTALAPGSVDGDNDAAPAASSRGL
jgi:hypothetical protein